MGRDNEEAPAHRRLSHALREQIAAGQFHGGRQLPTELELAGKYGLSRQTVRRAFYDLVAAYIRDRGDEVTVEA